jgi:hypothetical protein
VAAPDADERPLGLAPALAPKLEPAFTALWAELEGRPFGFTPPLAPNPEPLLTSLPASPEGRSFAFDLSPAAEPKTLFLGFCPPPTGLSFGFEGRAMTTVSRRSIIRTSSRESTASFVSASDDISTKPHPLNLPDWGSVNSLIERTVPATENIVFISSSVASKDIFVTYNILPMIFPFLIFFVFVESLFATQF